MIRYTGSSNAIDFSSLKKTKNSLSAEEMFKKVSQNSDDESFAIPKRSEQGIEDLNKPEEINKEEDESLLIKHGPDANIDFLKPKTVDGREKSEDSMPLIIYGQKREEPEFFYDGKSSSITNSFDALAVEIGAVNAKISKVQLFSYLQSLKKDESNIDASEQIAFVKNLIARFDDLANGGDYITSFDGVKEAQDYKTVTPEQVTLPIDIRI